MSLLNIAKSTKSRRRRRRSSTAISDAPNWRLAKLEDRLMLAGDVGVAVQAQVGDAQPQSQLGVADTTQTAIAARTIVVLDYRVDDIESLTGGVDDHAELIIVGQNQDAVEVIGQLIKSSRGKVDALHVVCHGRDGALEIGNSTLDSQALSSQADQLQQWRSQLTSDADILLYGCDVAATNEGIQFIRLMSQLTGADVVASSNRTGAASNAADWLLEHSTGKIDAALAFDAATRRSYQHTLSSVEIFAAGATGEENLDLLIDGEVVQTFSYVGGDASTRDFQRFTFDTDQTITPGNIGIRFTNDAFDPSIGLDRNLIVDRIVVDSVSVEAEDPSTFSTGIFADGGLTGPGFFETERLNINGTLTFADPVATGNGDLIEFDALGTTGEELVDLLVNGEVVQTFDFYSADPGVTQTFSFQSDDPNISIEDIRLEFVNDLFDPDSGIDRNVQIFEFRVIDGETGEVEKAKTSDSNVLSSGIFVDGGITEGLGAGGFLAGNFDGNAFVEISGGSGDVIQFDALGTTGEEFVDLLVNGEVVETFGFDSADPGVTQTFSFQSDDPDIYIEDIRLEFVNDAFDPATGLDRNVQIFEFRVVDGDTGAVQSASTLDSNVLSSGIFVDGGLTAGFGAGGFLAGDFAGNAFVEIVDDTGAGFTAVVADPTFQVTEGSLSFTPAIGPADQIVSITPSNEIQVVGSDGVPLSSFGGDGEVNLEELVDIDALGALVGIESTDLTISDLEFFDDGSVLASGFIEEAAGFLTPATPVVFRLSPDGTLDTSFQQGIVAGTLIELPGNAGPENVFAEIDSSGGIILLGTNPTGASGLQNFVVSRLNPDGTIDTSFANSGNQLILGSSFPDSGFGFPTGEVLGLDVSDSGDITFAFTSLGFIDGAPTDTVVVGRLLADGSVDQGFGENGFAVQSFDIVGPVLFQTTPDGGSVFVTTPLGSSIDSLLLLSPDGDVAAETLLPINSDILNDGVATSDIAGAVTTPLTFTTDIAVDQSGNIVLNVTRIPLGISSGTTLRSVIQRVLPSGVLDTGFGLDGSAILGDTTGAVDLIFDSEERLVVVGADRTRFEFV